MMCFSKLQSGLSKAQTVPLFGPIIISPMKAIVSIAQIIISLALAIFALPFVLFFGAFCLYNKEFGKILFGSLKSTVDGISQLAYSILNFITIGTAACLFEGIKSCFCCLRS